MCTTLLAARDFFGLGRSPKMRAVPLRGTAHNPQEYFRTAFKNCGSGAELELAGN
jgi:hypothetical protein